MNDFLFYLPLVIMVGAFSFLVYWAAGDAIERGKSPWLVSLAVVLFFPLGLLAWLLFRPETSNRPRFRLEDHRQ